MSAETTEQTKAVDATYEMLAGLDDLHKFLALKYTDVLIGAVLGVCAAGVEYKAVVAYLAKLEPLMEAYNQAGGAAS